MNIYYLLFVKWQVITIIGIVLAGGYGSRLASGGIKQIKPFLHIGGRGIIEYVIDNFSLFDKDKGYVKELIIPLQYGAKKAKRILYNDILPNHNFSYPLKHARSRQPKYNLPKFTHTCHAVWNIYKNIINENKGYEREQYGIMAGDLLVSNDVLSQLHDAHQFNKNRYDAWITIGVIKVFDSPERLSEYGTVNSNTRTNKVNRFVEKKFIPERNNALVNMTVYIAEPEFMNFMLKNPKTSEDLTQAITALSGNNGHVYSYEFNPEYFIWKDIANVQAAFDANFIILDNVAKGRSNITLMKNLVYDEKRNSIVEKSLGEEVKTNIKDSVLPDTFFYDTPHLLNVASCGGKTTIGGASNLSNVLLDYDLFMHNFVVNADPNKIKVINKEFITNFDESL